MGLSGGGGKASTNAAGSAWSCAALPGTRLGGRYVARGVGASWQGEDEPTAEDDRNAPTDVLVLSRPEGAADRKGGGRVVYRGLLLLPGGAALLPALPPPCASLVEIFRLLPASSPGPVPLNSSETSCEARGVSAHECRRRKHH
jgi:hypothetical protein